MITHNQHHTFYITAKGLDSALRLLRHNPLNPTLEDNLTTFIATSGDTGVTAEFYMDELGHSGISLLEVEQTMSRMHEDKIITPWKSGLCKRADMLVDNLMACRSDKE